MDAMSFFCNRFNIPNMESFEIGDEVVDKYGAKAVVVREPYYINGEGFVLIFYGQYLSSTTTKSLTKTGKNHKEVGILLNKLKED